MNVSELIKRITFSKAYEFLDHDPEQNFLKLVDWLEKLDKNGYIAKQLPVIRKYAKDPDSNWYRLALSLWNDVDDEVRKTLFTNFMINGNVLENQKLLEQRKKYRCNIPWAIMMSPAQNGENLSFDEMDGVVEQGKELGTYFFAFSGEDGLVERRNDVIALCNKNSECVFLYETDGSMIDQGFAEEMLRVRNLIPVLHLDGFEQEMDELRGAGAFVSARRAMEILKKNRLLFSVACCYTSENWETVSGEAFFDALVEQGAKAAWFGPYLPVGPKASTSLMVSGEQRAYLRRQLKNFRKTKPILTLDPWNDGEIVGGCVAAGRGYCRITAKGDVEPCAYVHYSDSNIREKTLLEAYRSPLFMAFYRNQPFHRNLLRPCPLLDHPESLNVLVETAGAHSSDRNGSEDVQDLTARCVKPAEEWAGIADRLWRESGRET
jgi:MoaA/NifB/PqqE/SkfB family radical SAM enzyme